MNGAWSAYEVELIVADYFQMLSAELAGTPYSKAEHRKMLQPLLTDRSEGSIEFKHQNISAVLINYGLFYISGYKPRWNYQQLLETKVQEYLTSNYSIEDQFRIFANQVPESKSMQLDYGKWIVPPPERNIFHEPKAPYFRPIKTNYLELEQRNRTTGEEGEALVVEYEKWKLKTYGKARLADQVKWISKEEGDGAGYDILSKDLSGNTMYIEVKSTKLGKETPFFFTKTENDFSEIKKEAYHLYRVFDLKDKPKMFNRNGRFQDFCSMEAVSFRGSV